MKRKVQIALVTVGVVATLVAATGILRSGVVLGAGRDVVAADRQAQLRRIAGPQPDTSSPDWKLLANDVGVLLRDDERLGLRGRLYVRLDDVWLPVATDGVADVRSPIPVQ
jgi:hypothetical protein